MPPLAKPVGTRAEQLAVSIDVDKLPPNVLAVVSRLLDHAAGAVAVADDDRAVRFGCPLLEAALAGDIVRMAAPRCRVYVCREESWWEPVARETPLTLKNPTRLNPAVFPPVLDFVPVAPKIARLV